MEEKRHSPVTNRSDTQPEEPNNLHLLVQSIPRSRSGSPHASNGSTNQQGSSSIQTGNSDEKKRRNSGELDGPLPKRTSAIASKFQASLKVKEQQQAIIEARLVSPPGGASNQESFSFNQRPLQPAPLSRLTVPKHTSSNDPYTAPPHSAPPPHDHHNSNQYPPQPYRPISGPPTATGHYNERSKIPLPPPSPSSHHPPPHSAFPSTTGNYPHHSPPQQQTLHNPYPQQQQQQQPPPQPLPPSSSTSSRRAFLSLFESVYDTASDDLPKLVATLKDQMRKSSSLLQTLQASGQMIEGLVRSCFRDMQVQYGEKFGAALADLNRRVEVLEGRLGQAGGGSGQSGYGGSGSQGQSQAHGQARGSGVEYSNTGFRGEPMTPAVKPPSLDFPVPAQSSTSTSGSSGSGQQQHSHSDQTPHDVNALLKSLMDRLDQLEKK